MTSFLTSLLRSRLQLAGAEGSDSEYDDSTWSYLAEILAGDEITLEEKKDWLQGMFPALALSKETDLFKLLKDLIASSREKPKQDISTSDRLDEISQSPIVLLENSLVESMPHCTKTFGIDQLDSKTIASRVVVGCLDILSRHGIDCADLDESIMEYLLQSIVDISDEDERRSFLSSYLPITGKLPDEIERDLLLFARLHVEEKLNKKETKKIIPLTRLSLPETSSQVTSSWGKLSRVVENIIYELASPTKEAFETLRELFHDVPVDLILFVFRNECEDCELRTIEMLIELKDNEELRQQILSRKTAYENKMALEMKKCEDEAKSMKKSIARMYGDKEFLTGPGGLRELNVSGGAKKHSSKDEALQIAVLNDSGSGRVRYRDGVAVAFKGEKVVIEKDPRDDYDGGSRGKVKTKGKRGPGFTLG